VQVRTLLGALAVFQERAKEKDPIKANAKKRYVLGIKQVKTDITEKTRHWH
jgi:hypothetical protein